MHCWRPLCPGSSFCSTAYGRVEGKHERSLQEQVGGRARWAPLFGLTFMAWTAIIIVYFFHEDSAHWVLRLAFLEHRWVRILAMVLMCGAFVLYVVFTATVGRAIGAAVETGGQPELITSGVYRFCRHPAYLAFLAVACGIFLTIANLITLLLLLGTAVVIGGHAAEEERRLLSVYGEQYQRYQEQVGRFWPRLG